MSETCKDDDWDWDALLDEGPVAEPETVEGPKLSALIEYDPMLQSLLLAFCDAVYATRDRSTARAHWVEFPYVIDHPNHKNMRYERSRWAIRYLRQDYRPMIRWGRYTIPDRRYGFSAIEVKLLFDEDGRPRAFELMYQPEGSRRCVTVTDLTRKSLVRTLTRLHRRSESERRDARARIMAIVILVAIAIIYAVLGVEVPGLIR